MAGSALEGYLAGVADPRAVAKVRELDRVIRAAHPDFQVAIKYRILMYALHGDWHTWVCAINAQRNRLALHFLYGVLLSDPRRVLRAGSSVLMSWDFGFDEVIDPAAVGAYVSEALARNAEYKANREGVLDASRAAAAEAGRRPKSRR